MDTDPVEIPRRAARKGHRALLGVIGGLAIVVVVGVLGSIFVIGNAVDRLFARTDGCDGCRALGPDAVVRRGAVAVARIRQIA